LEGDKINILSLHYLGNIHYFGKLLQGNCVIDIHENYVKQSFRNRCEIMTADGVFPLSIQTVKGRQSILNTKIDYSKRWQHQHWNAIHSAYKNSPYFDYYGDAYEPFYHNKYETIFDFNSQLLEVTLKLLGSNIKPIYSECYIDVTSENEDWRDRISPKSRLCTLDNSFKATEYWQVFEERNPFARNLSVLDILFCEGPNARGIIESSVVR